jgi:hypothetical protein
MAQRLQVRNDRLPRGPVEPQTGDKENIHVMTIEALPDDRLPDNRVAVEAVTAAPAEGTAANLSKIKDH